MSHSKPTTFPHAPFLLTGVEKDNTKRYYIVDSWKGQTNVIGDNGQFEQTFTWTAHNATEEEIDRFMKDE